MFSNKVSANLNSSVTLSCELYGYLPMDSRPLISWSKVGSDLIFSTTDGEGSRRIQNGESSPRPSLVSNLTIDVAEESAAGLYICSSVSVVRTIQLVINPGIKLAHNNNYDIYSADYIHR